MTKHLFIFLMLLTSPLLAQNKAVTGRVTDAASGDGLPGVNILVKGTQLGTASDAEGAFVIEVPADGTTLVFSFIGYTTVELPVKIRSRSSWPCSRIRGS